MANIALREYHRKIERLIENHQIEEAFSHCANILRKFPKEIETYRKLGKNFLEKQDIDLSERVFNIILSVFPDDFVANVGLSFIHENKGEMDQAIDHMLMAFELQPANPSLQDELKRLYHKRDSVEPNKIRLTRGALIKMYARSNLFEQAIAEIKLGLYEKPNRIDFKLILADMLWKAGSRIEAVETCVDIVSQLPYCWKANEILDLAFQDLHHEQADSNYRLRLAELDPYYRFMLPATQSVADIPDIAVQIDSDLDEENGINDWGNFLSDTWVVSSLPAVEEASDDDLDWNAILDEAGQEQESAQEQSSAGITLFEELTRDRDNELLTLNRRQSFIERLQKRGREPKFEGTNESGESNAETGLSSEVQSLPEEISPQSNVQSAPVQEGNTPEEFDTFASGAETDPTREPPLDTGAAPGFAEDKNESAEIAESPLVDTVAKAGAVETGGAAGADLIHDLEFPAAEDECGLIDHDAPVEISEVENSQPAASQWVKDVFEPEASAAPVISLQDTQQIRVAPLTPGEILQHSRQLIDQGDFAPALRFLRELAEEDDLLADVRDVLEAACRDYPQESNLWLALGNIYQRLNQKEKALEVFTRAQKSISL